ncbi:helix-turn-helix transcriptional regulator [Kribbella sp. NPDC023972]|uniref:helix-turn-helix domain-containing protein n=1 Tax=Kribbella sp. NPDC023972 TaxID=3154795 RepID=UPI0033F0627E
MQIGRWHGPYASEGLLQADVAHRLGWSIHKLSLIETARVRVDPSEMEALLALCIE